jgi:hypothetical protein
MTVEHEQGDKETLDRMRLQIEVLERSMAHDLRTAFGSRKAQHDRLTDFAGLYLLIGHQIDRTTNHLWRKMS